MIKVLSRFLVIFVIIVALLVGKFSIFTVGENIVNWYSLTTETKELNNEVTTYVNSIKDKEAQFAQERGDTDHQVLERVVTQIKKLPGVVAKSSEYNIVTTQGVLTTTNPQKATGVTLELKVKDTVETARKLDGLNMFIEQMDIDPIAKTISITIRTGEVTL